MQKKQFSQLPKKDVLLAFKQFNRQKYSDDEKLKLTRKILHQVYSSYLSAKLLNIKNKTPEWILKKHFSTRERLPYYKKIYQRVLRNADKKCSIIDLGAGVNGFSYDYLEEIGFKVNYVAIESMGQLVDLTNDFFKRNKINGKVVHLSLFELNKVKAIIKKQKKPRIVFLFKVVDSLELLKRNYSKELLLEITPLCNRIILSFATKTISKRKNFKVKRKWLTNFIYENFKVLDDFETAGERYLVFEGNKFKKKIQLRLL